MTVALFPPCGANCTQVVQGQTTTIDYADIVGYTPEAREARVMWWTYTRDQDGTLRPTGGVRTVEVRLD
jgi:hypothetical protein